MSEIVPLPAGAAPNFRIFLSASGSIGHTLTATRWNNCQYWRPYSYPSRGKTAAQAKVRELFAVGISAWRREFKSEKIREDWNRSAGYADTTMSGYDQFISSAYHASVNDPDSVFIKGYVLQDDHLSFTGTTLRIMTMPAVSQEIDFFIGYNPWQQTYVATRSFQNGVLWSPTFPGPGTYYIRMSSQGIPVSGLIRYVYRGE